MGSTRVAWILGQRSTRDSDPREGHETLAVHAVNAGRNPIPRVESTRVAWILGQRSTRGSHPREGHVTLAVHAVNAGRNPRMMSFPLSLSSRLRVFLPSGPRGQRGTSSA